MVGPRSTSASSDMRLISLLLILLLTGACGGGDSPPDSDGTSNGSGEELIAEGQRLYEQNCAMCHGIDLKGTDTGPPFLSPIYAPNHHPDESFQAAVANGVEPHHWEFGPMPAQPAVGPEDVTAIVAYVRTEQREAGITEDPSHP